MTLPQAHIAGRPAYCDLEHGAVLSIDPVTEEIRHPGLPLSAKRLEASSTLPRRDPVRGLASPAQMWLPDLSVGHCGPACERE